MCYNVITVKERLGNNNGSNEVYRNNNNEGNHIRSKL